MNKFNLLDENLINSIISRYCIHDPRNFSQEVRFAEWDRLKGWLFKNIFKDTLILETPNVEIERTKENLFEDISDELINSHFVQSILFILERENIYQNLIEELKNEESYYNNKYAGSSYTFTAHNGKEYKISKGEKMMKVLSKIFKTYEDKLTSHGIYEAEFEDFREEHSRILNDKHIKGTLCLSIHPLDYITMSDNKYNWSSCMSWEDVGCYRTGTLEMMNSPYVIVAYLKGTEEYRGWNSKKWRTLLVVTKDLITSIKNYPYHSEELTNMCLTWVKELIEKNTQTTFYPNLLAINFSNNEPNDNPTIGDLYSLNENNETIYREIKMFTDYMYNDFYDYHNCYVSKDFFDSEYSYGIDYSGQATCIECGSPCYFIEDYDDDADFLLCSECRCIRSCSQCDRPYSDTGSSNLCCNCERVLEISECVNCGERDLDNIKIYTDEKCDCPIYICNTCFEKLKSKNYFSTKKICTHIFLEPKDMVYIKKRNKLKKEFPELYKKIIIEEREERK